jgi:lantibiotic modifying enzyme
MGESTIDGFETSFYKLIRKITSSKSRERTIWKERITFWCSYGPSTKPSNIGHEKRKQHAKVQVKQGCRFHFIISRHFVNDIACISYIHGFHTNEDNVICHGGDLKDE